MQEQEPGYIYFVVCWETERVKIGYSGDHPSWRRFSQLQSCSSTPLFRWGYVRGTKGTEQKIHRRFDKYRLHGEWFEIRGPEMFALLHEAVNNWVFEGTPSDYERNVINVARGEIDGLQRLTVPGLIGRPPELYLLAARRFAEILRQVEANGLLAFA